jgi:O-antigen ligase
MSDGLLKPLLLVVLACVGVVFISLSIGFVGPLPSFLLVFSLMAACVVLIFPTLGVSILLLLLPLASTHFLPRQMFGVMGLNPLNLLVVATFLSLYLNGKVAFGEKVKAFRLQTMTLMLLPMCYGAVIGVGQIDEIPASLIQMQIVDVESAGGYLAALLIKPLVMLVVAFLVCCIVVERGNSRLVFLLVAISAVIFGAVICGRVFSLGISLRALGGDSPVLRNVLSFTGLHANSIGLMFNIVIAFCISGFLSTRLMSERLIFGLAASISVIVVGITFSRAGMLGLMFTCAYFVLSRGLGLVALLWLSVLLFALLWVPDVFWDRLFTGVASNSSSKITAGRLEAIWMPLLRYMDDKWFLGDGLMSVAWSEANKFGEMLPVTHAHNAYLNAVHEVGVIGLVLVSCFYFAIYRMTRECDAWVHRDYDYGAMIALRLSIFVLALQCFSGDNLLPTASQTYLWVGVGMAFGISHNQKRCVGAI